MMIKKVCRQCGGEIESIRLTVLDTPICAKCARKQNGNILTKQFDAEQELRIISENLCGIKVEGDVTLDMVYSFVEGQIDKQSDRADKANEIQHAEKEILLKEIEAHAKTKAEKQAAEKACVQYRHNLMDIVEYGGTDVTDVVRHALVVCQAALKSSEHGKGYVKVDDFTKCLEVEKSKREAAEKACAEMRSVLDKLARLGNEPYYGNSIGNTMARDAIESSEHGKGYVKAEDVKPMKEALQWAAGSGSRPSAECVKACEDALARAKELGI